MDYLNLPRSFRNERYSFITEMPLGTEHTIMEAEGPGAVRHIWMTDSAMTFEDKSFDENYGRDVILRIYFDGAEIPQVECPFDDFFGMGWRRRFGFGDKEFCPIRSPYLTQAPNRSGFNCYFPMPYAESIRFTVEYDPATKRNWWPHIYLQADVHRYEKGSLTEPLRFHARWRRENPCEEMGEHFLLADIPSAGYLAGFSMGVRVRSGSDAWFHAGGDFVYLDGEGEGQVLHGIGMEDLFGSSYGTAPFSAPYIGCPYHDAEWVSYYRFFVEDAIAFRSSCRIMIGGIGNDYAGVAYWYQPGTAPRCFIIPPSARRIPAAELPRGEFDTGVGKTARWELVGPFPLDDPGDFDADFGPERDFGGRCGERWKYSEAGKSMYRVWARDFPEKTVDRIEKDSYHNFIDFNATQFRPGVGGICCSRFMLAYARRKVTLEEDLQTRIHLGFDDQLALFIDGKRVFRGEHARGFRNTSVAVHLSKGEHEILIKLSNFDNSTWRSWAFCCRVAGVDEMPGSAAASTVRSEVFP